MPESSKGSWLFTCLLVIIISSYATARQSLVADSGVIDFSIDEFPESGVLALQGEWEFFYQKLATELEPTSEGSIIQVPGDWKEVFDFGPHFTEGFGTYRLIVKSLNPNKIYGLKIPTIHSASRITINEQVFSEFGKVGKSREEMVPDIGGQVILFKPETTSVEILIEVSNFHFFQSGIWSPIYLGEQAEILTFDRRDRMFSFLLVGALLIMGIYHLFLAFIQRSFLESMFFGLACLFLALRELAGPDAILLDILPNIGHTTIVRLVYLSLGFALMFQSLFVFQLFLKAKEKWVYRVNVALIGVFALGVLLLNTRDASIFFNYYAIIAAPPFIVYGIFVVIRGAFQSQEGSIIFLIGLIFFYGAAIHDFFWAYSETGNGTSSYWLPYGFFFLILSQSVMLSIRFNKAFISEAVLAEKLKLTNQSLRRFIPKEFLKLLGKDEIVEVELGDSISKDMTVLFADVRNFTSLSEGLTSKQTFEFINQLLKRTDPIITRNNGFIDKYIGDAVMALFEESPDLALQAALELQEEISRYNQIKKTTIGLGIGIHFGNLILGTVGSEKRMDGTVISDAVNTASRIEELTKTYQVPVLISEDCLMMLKKPENFGFRIIDQVNLRGRKAKTKLYEIFTLDREFPKGFLEHFEDAVSNFRSVRVEEARVLFEKCIVLDPRDGPSQYFLKKINDYQRVQGKI